MPSRISSATRIEVQGFIRAGLTITQIRSASNQPISLKSIKRIAVEGGLSIADPRDNERISNRASDLSRVGEKVGFFIIEEFLGNSRHGPVFRVRDLRCDHEAEIKIRRSLAWHGFKRLCDCLTECIVSGGYPALEWHWKGRNVTIPKHRLVMESIIGRPLNKDETIHHIDGNRENFQPENLQLRQGPHGRGTIVKCYDCGSSNIGPMPLEGKNVTRE